MRELGKPSFEHFVRAIDLIQHADGAKILSKEIMVPIMLQCTAFAVPPGSKIQWDKNQLYLVGE